MRSVGSEKIPDKFLRIDMVVDDRLGRFTGQPIEMAEPPHLPIGGLKSCVVSSDSAASVPTPAPEDAPEHTPEGPQEDTWIAISGAELPVHQASDWATVPSCGAVVTFTGTARDHSTGREDVTRLEYEAYEEEAVPRLRAVADEIRKRWPDVARIAMIHRVGEVPLTHAAVVVVVSAPHRDAAFEAGRFGIDTLKSTVPIWKREDWAEGTSWGLEAQHIVSVDAVD